MKPPKAGFVDITVTPGAGQGKSISGPNLSELNKALTSGYVWSTIQIPSVPGPVWVPMTGLTSAM